MIADQITDFYNEHHFSSSRQMIRKDSSAEDLLIQLFKDWKDALDVVLITCVIALDFRGLFDGV